MKKLTTLLLIITTVLACNVPEPSTNDCLQIIDSLNKVIADKCECEPQPEIPTDTIVTPPVDTVILDTLLPEGLNNTMMFGLFENYGGKWMKESSVPWNARYMYLVNGWVNNWGWSQDSGSLAYNYMVESEAMGAMPFLEFYPLTYLGWKGADLTTKIAADTLMYDFFNQYRILIKRAKQFGKPVIIAIEADGLCFIQIQSDANPDQYASVNNCGIKELENLPNTIAGWNKAFIAIRDELGADNVILGLHISHWATGEDLLYQSPIKDLHPFVDEVCDFLEPLGVNDYDLLIADPLDRDAGYYTSLGQNKWLNMDSEASINSSSYNRYAEWLRLFNERTGKRIVLWQIPLGNKYHLNVKNTHGDREGYQDNKVEYFSNRDNIAKFAESGVIGLLFGAGATYQSDHLNDYDNEGNLYMKSVGFEYYSNGRMDLKR